MKLPMKCAEHDDYFGAFRLRKGEEENTCRCGGAVAKVEELTTGLEVASALDPRALDNCDQAGSRMATRY